MKQGENVHITPYKDICSDVMISWYLNSKTNSAIIGVREIWGVLLLGAKRTECEMKQNCSTRHRQTCAAFCHMVSVCQNILLTLTNWACISFSPPQGLLFYPKRLSEHIYKNEEQFEWRVFFRKFRSHKYILYMWLKNPHYMNWPMVYIIPCYLLLLLFVLSFVK